VKRRKEAALRVGIMRTVAALQAAQPEPDAWMRLVLERMPVEELRREIAKADDKSADEVRWLRAELIRKERAANG
jgi:hypothetical protein